MKKEDIPNLIRLETDTRIPDHSGLQAVDFLEELLEQQKDQKMPAPSVQRVADSVRIRFRAENVEIFVDFDGAYGVTLQYQAALLAPVQPVQLNHPRLLYNIAQVLTNPKYGSLFPPNPK